MKDAFYDYENGDLVLEKHDTNNDGETDLKVTYKNRHRMQSEEDRSKDGQVDTWTYYEIVEGKEVVSRIERDSKGRGQADVFESFDTATGKPVLAKREEDVNGDGNVDVTSIYKDGKLVKREISDPALVPL